MPQCFHPKCKREGLPTAPGLSIHLPSGACAHVNGDGEPCPLSPSTQTFDQEFLEFIIKEDGIWDPEFRAPLTEFEQFAVEVPAPPTSLLAVAHAPEQKRKRGRKSKRDLDTELIQAISEVINQPHVKALPAEQITSYIANLPTDDDLDDWEP